MNKIAIISDTHNNIPRGEEVRKILEEEKIFFIIHCGDIGDKDYLKNVFKGFKVRAVFGNMDEGYGEVEDYQNEDIIVYNKIGEEEINGKKIAFTHFPQIAKKIAKKGYDFVFYGHTHKPWKEEIGNTTLLNPGNVTGTFCKPTFAIYDFKKDDFQLRLLKS